MESIDDERTNASERERTSKYTAPPNPQGSRPRSMRSLAVFSTEYYLAAWIATHGSPCLLSTEW
jgi:hypothetical protein